MTTHPKARETAKNGRRPRHIAVRSLNVLLLAAIGWMVIYSGRTLTTGNSDSRRSAADAADVEAPISAASIANIEDGYWNLAGLAWDVAVRVIDSGELRACLSADPTIPSIAGPITAEEVKALKLVKSVARVLQRNAEQTAYGVDSATLKVRVFTRSQGKVEHLASGYVAFPLTRDRWTLLMVTRPRDAQVAGRNQASLLPFAIGTYTRIGARFDRHDRLTCEIVSLVASLDELRRLCGEQGWATKESAWHDREGLLLVRDDDAVQLLPLVSGKTSVYVLIRVPPALIGS